MSDPQIQTPAQVSAVPHAVGISIQDIRVEYAPGNPILDGLSLEVAPAEIIALVGASGCGKSTLLRAIASLLTPVSGSIDLHFQNVGRGSDGLSYVFQDPTLLPWRSVRANVALPLELRTSSSKPSMGVLGNPHAQSADPIGECLRAVGLDEATWGKLPRELSGGMRMRTSIARALVTDPNVLLLDEPFAALDDLLRSRMNDLILELWAHRPRTVLFVTHNIAEAAYMSNRIAVFGHRRISKVLENQLPWPRNAAQRTSLEFARQYGAISEALAEVAEA